MAIWKIVKIGNFPNGRLIGGQPNTQNFFKWPFGGAKWPFEVQPNAP
jgi:hypothetical protein